MQLSFKLIIRIGNPSVLKATVRWAKSVLNTLFAPSDI
jgi:succinylglutamate desuccinylase